MVNTNSKEFRENVRAHIRTQLRGKGGVSKIVRDIDNYTAQTKYGIEHHIKPRTVREAAEMMIEAPEFLFDSYSQRTQLHRWGLTDDKRIDRFNNYGGVWDLYKAIMVKEIISMYSEMKKPKSVKKKVVKKTTKAKARK